MQVVAVIASNDPFVMSAWGKANNVKNDDIVSPSLRKYFPCSIAHDASMVAFPD